MTRLVRVVSLVPSATETLLALGAGVVACTKYCEQPSLPHVGGTKNPDIGAIVGLTPDLVVVDEEENRREDAGALRAAGLELVVTAVRDVRGGRNVVGRLARHCAVTPPRPPPSAPVDDALRAVHLSAFVPIWRRPWMSINADTYGASVLAHAGVGLVTAGDEGRYPAVELAALAGTEPDLVLVPSEPYAFGDAHVAELAAHFPRARVVRIDGKDLFWWGVRTDGAVERLRAVVTRAASTR